METELQTITAEFLKVAEEMGWERKPYVWDSQCDVITLNQRFPFFVSINIIIQNDTNTVKSIGGYDIRRNYDISFDLDMGKILLDIMVMKDIMWRGC